MQLEGFAAASVGSPVTVSVCIHTHLQAGVDKVLVEALDKAGTVAPGKLSLQLQVGQPSGGRHAHRQ